MDSVWRSLIRESGLGMLAWEILLKRVSVSLGDSSQKDFMLTWYVEEQKRGFACWFIFQAMKRNRFLAEERAPESRWVAHLGTANHLLQ